VRDEAALGEPNNAHKSNVKSILGYGGRTTKVFGGIA
jgi:hypothetical protein